MQSSLLASSRTSQKIQDEQWLCSQPWGKHTLHTHGPPGANALSDPMHPTSACTSVHRSQLYLQAIQVKLRLNLQKCGTVQLALQGWSKPSPESSAGDMTGVPHCGTVLPWKQRVQGASVSIKHKTTQVGTGQQQSNSSLTTRIRPSRT